MAKKEMKKEMVAEDGDNEAAEMKKGGKAKKFKRGGAAKHEMKAEGHASKKHMGKPAKKASGGSVDSTDAGVTPSKPFAVGSPMRAKGGKC